MIICSSIGDDRRHTRALYAALAVIAMAACNSSPGGPVVLSATTQAAVGTSVAAAKVIRERTVTVNTAAFSPPHNQIIDLPLFDDTVVRAVGIRTEPAGKGYVWIGQLQDQPLSDVILSVQDGNLAGNVITDSGDNYEIRPAG